MFSSNLLQLVVLESAKDSRLDIVILLHSFYELNSANFSHCTLSILFLKDTGFFHKRLSFLTFTVTYTLHQIAAGRREEKWFSAKQFPCLCTLKCLLVSDDTFV